MQLLTEFLSPAHVEDFADFAGSPHSTTATEILSDSRKQAFGFTASAHGLDYFIGSRFTFTHISGTSLKSEGLKRLALKFAFEMVSEKGLLRK
jgi:hypothetical protein